jgi:hypothetical protein
MHCTDRNHRRPRIPVQESPCKSVNAEISGAAAGQILALLCPTRIADRGGHLAGVGRPVADGGQASTGTALADDLRITFRADRLAGGNRLASTATVADEPAATIALTDATWEATGVALSIPLQSQAGTYTAVVMVALSVRP